MGILKFRTSDDIQLAMHHAAPRPPKGIKAVVLFIGGVESHGGWYEESLRYLGQEGIEVYFLDRRGNGKSDGKRGDLPSLQKLQDDLSEVAQWVYSRHPGAAFTLAAISLGSQGSTAILASNKKDSFPQSCFDYPRYLPTR